MEKFIVLATQRSGTRFFETVLSDHPKIQCYGELLLWMDYHNPDNFFHYWRNKVLESAKFITPPFEAVAFKQYLDDLFTQNNDMQAVGLDIKYDQVGVIPNELPILQEKFKKAIHLIRCNLLKTLISLELNRRKEEFARAAHASQKYASARITLLMNEGILGGLKDRKRQILNFREYLSNHYDTIEIYYEDFFGNGNGASNTIKKEVLSQVYDFLGVKSCFDVKTDLVKTNPNRLVDLIENYEEVKLFLELNGWGYLLDEEGYSVPEMVAVTGKNGSVEAGKTYLQNGQIEAAFQFFKKYYHQNPHDPEIASYFGNLLFRSGQVEKARKLFQILFEKYPRNEKLTKTYQLLQRIYQN